MSREDCLFYHLVFKKIVKELQEAYNRTPFFISSKAMVEKALKLALSGLSKTSECIKEFEENENKV